MNLWSMSFRKMVASTGLNITGLKTDLGLLLLFFYIICMHRTDGLSPNLFWVIDLSVELVHSSF